MRTHYDEADVDRYVKALASKISLTFPKDQALNVIGILTRGETLAQRIAHLLQESGHTRIGRGVLDITMYRDDLSKVGPAPLVRPTSIQIDLNSKPALLIDDVIFSGRSIRAALDALTDFGRPSVIRVAVLVDRWGRELPIQPDFVGAKIGDAPIDHRVNVHLKEIDGKDEIVVEPRP